MKNTNKIYSNQTGLNEYLQADSAGTHCQGQKVEEVKPSSENARQLYATEAEEYFFYFLPVHQNQVIGIAV